MSTECLATLRTWNSAQAKTHSSLSARTTKPGSNFSSLNHIKNNVTCVMTFLPNQKVMI